MTAASTNPRPENGKTAFHNISSNGSFEGFAIAAAALEFPKVLKRVAAAALSTFGAEQILALRPVDDFTALQDRLDETTEMRNLLDTDEALPLATLPELRTILQHLQIAGRALAVRELVDLTNFSATARRVRGFLMERRERYARLAAMAANLTSMQPLEREIEAAISFVDGSIKNSASPVLARLRKDIARATAEARATLQKIAKRLAARDMLQESMITLREGRLVLMLKDEHRHRVPGLVHDESASGSTVFLEPLESVTLNNRIRQLQIAEREEIERILLALTDRFRQALPALETNHALMIGLDVIHAKATISRMLNAHPPFLQETAKFKLLGARHPLLLLRGEGQTTAVSNAVVPLDLELGMHSSKPEDATFTVIISGPNAGGKTVALKTAGLLALMALCGLHVPAEPDSELPFFQNIFVDIGDRQSIEEDLSTFTSHVARLVEIVEHARPGDLILIDEIGAGTDPEAGAALALAILQELTRRGCLTIATTHHGALKNFAQHETGIINASMEFDQESLRPTYKFRAGLPGASYAFEIAERMGLDGRVIAAAREFVGSDKANAEALLADLQSRLTEQQQLNEKLQGEESRLSELRQRYEERWASLKAQEKELKRKAIAEAEALLQNANAALEKAVREIREQNAAREAVRAAKESLQTVREQIVAEQQQLSSAPEPAEEGIHEVRPGMQVMWLKQNAVAAILETPDSSNKVLVGVGNLRARVPLAELRALKNAPQSRPASLPKTASSSARRGPEIDLRGLRVEEALVEVDKFLDDALLAGWSEIRLIHGKGTGALRKSIADYLKGNSAIRSFRAAPLGEGDAGVTIVELS